METWHRLAAQSSDDRLAMWERVLAAGLGDVSVAALDGAVVGFVATGESRDADADAEVRYRLGL